MRSRLTVSVALVLSAGEVPAQVVRGVVRDAVTRSPIPGVIVSLDEAVTQLDTDGSLRRSSLVLSVLTNERGEYRVQATAAGRYVLSAKRVGLRRFESAPVQLNVGEARSIDVELQRIDFAAALPAVSVTTDAPCAVNPRENARVAALWEEARAALTATRLSLRDRLFRATTVRYVRELSAPRLRVLREDQVIRRGVTERPFASLAADRLSANGYVQVDGDGTNVFYAPDAAVLTSPEFLRDHCFSLSRDSRERRGLVGLAFQPVRSRTLPDIRGALWMDSASFELRIVEFRYANLPDHVTAPDARGEVRFGRLSNGAWHVSRWFIRMPEYRAARATAAVPIAGLPTLSQYREEGGDVTVEGTSTAPRGAVLTGRAMDSTGRAPLRNAIVRLTGTRYQAPVIADGSFRLDSLPAGAYTLTLEHPTYAALGMPAAEQDLEVAENSASLTALHALGTDQVLRRLCGYPQSGDDRAAARVVVRTVDGAVAPGVEVNVRFETFVMDTPGLIGRRPITDKVRTDSLGVAMFCELPARRPLHFDLMLPGERSVTRQVHTLPPHSIAVITFRP